MYAFVYVDPKTMPVEENFNATKTFVGNYRKISTPGPVPKYWIGFSYICLEDYEFDKNFDETEFINYTTHPTIKLNYSPKILWSLRKNGLAI